MQHSPSTSVCRPRPPVHAAFLHEQGANRPCGLMYRTIFFFTNSCVPELAHRLQTSEMRRNSTSLDSCQHDDINSTVKATATVCQAFYHILRSIKTRFIQERLFYTQGPFFCALGPLFFALVREKAIFAVCKWYANEVFACMCKEKDFFGFFCI